MNSNKNEVNWIIHCLDEIRRKKAKSYNSENYVRRNVKVATYFNALDDEKRLRQVMNREAYGDLAKERRDI
jgi:hypothetical protein